MNNIVELIKCENCFSVNMLLLKQRHFHMKTLT